MAVHGEGGLLALGSHTPPNTPPSTIDPCGWSWPCGLGGVPMPNTRCAFKSARAMGLNITKKRKRKSKLAEHRWSLGGWTLARGDHNRLQACNTPRASIVDAPGRLVLLLRVLVFRVPSWCKQHCGAPNSTLPGTCFRVQPCSRTVPEATRLATRKMHET